MKKAGNPEKKPLMERMKELGQKHGVKVTDLSKRGVRAIGIVGGIKIKTSPQLMQIVQVTTRC
jgi:hypothetical protein